MKLVKTITAAALFGMSASAFAAFSDLTYTTHGPQYGQNQKVGEIIEPRRSDYGAEAPSASRDTVEPVTESVDNSRWSDLTAVTHDITPVPRI